MSKWKEYQLGDLITFQRGHDLPKTKMQGGIYPVVGSNGIIGYHNEYTTEAPSITIGRSGNVGKPFLYNGKTWSHNTSLYIKEYKNVDPIFIYYYLQTLDLGNYAGGSAVPTLNRNHIHTLNVSVPVAIEEQKQIASILSSLDDKIKLNTAINENLEQQAQALFKAWFVDFEPFGGVMPEDWQETTLGNIAEISTKSINPIKQPELFLEHYSIPAYDDQHYPVFEYASEIKSNKYVLSNNSVMISKLNPETKRIWRPLCLTENPVCSTEFIVYEPINPEHKDYIYSLIDSQAFSDYLCAHTTGSTNSRQRATPKTTLDFACILPCDDCISKFCGIVTPLYEHIGANLIENQRLSALRDTLLPKLMNGEIDVSQVRI